MVGLAGSFFKFWISVIVFIPPDFFRSTEAELFIEWCAWAGLGGSQDARREVTGDEDASQALR